MNELISNHGDKDFLRLAIIAGWQIWKMRNKMAFRNAQASVPKVLSLIRFHFGSNGTLQQQRDRGRGNLSKTTTTIRWSCPSPPFVKLNYDGSVHHNSAAGGFAITDNLRRVIQAGAKAFGNTSVPVVEVLALREGLLKSRNAGLMHIQVEGDSKLVIDAGQVETAAELREEDGVVAVNSRLKTFAPKLLVLTCLNLAPFLLRSVPKAGVERRRKRKQFDHKSNRGWVSKSEVEFLKELVSDSSLQSLYIQLRVLFYLG